MRTYKFKYKALFTGEVEVRAENRYDAREIVENDFGGPLITVSNGCSISEDENKEGVVDYDFDTHPQKVTII